MDFSEIHEGKLQGLAAFSITKRVFGNEPPRVRFQRDFLCLEDVYSLRGANENI